MKFVFTQQFRKNYQKLSPEVQKQFNKKLMLFKNSFNHPSLRIEKLKGSSYWAGSIDMNYRFVFNPEGNMCVFMNIGSHKILNRF